MYVLIRDLVAADVIKAEGELEKVLHLLLAWACSNTLPVSNLARAWESQYPQYPAPS